jgi:hypothetical protein
MPQFGAVGKKKTMYERQGNALIRGHSLKEARSALVSTT